MNQTVKNQTSLEDFEEFDLRDAINVALYGFMSVGKNYTIYVHPNREI